MGCGLYACLLYTSDVYKRQGDISAEKRLNHPQDLLKQGQIVKAQVLEIDSEKRRLRLGMKQLVPTGLDEYLSLIHI